MLEESETQRSPLELLDYASALKDRPVLIVEADDRNLSDNQALATALRKLGNPRVIETHMATDHIFSDHRIALQAVVVEWLGSVVGQKAK